jgi:hypothetical protein
MARYYIQAKRNGEDSWTEWTQVDSYPRAMEHVKKAREAGFESRLVPSDEVKKLWYFLGEKETALTDEILDAGFGLYDKRINNVLGDLKTAIHNKAIFPDAKEVPSYIPLKVFDAILQKFIRKVNTDAE